MPFWFAHGVDPAGGINTCMTEDGQLVSRDKWLWSQWRAVWVLSRLYRRTRDARYIDWASNIVRFCCGHGWSDDGWLLCVTAEGAPLRGAESLYVDAFATYALAEYARATDDADARRWLERTVARVIGVLGRPHDRIPHFPYPVPPGMRVHGIPMLFSYSLFTAADQLRQRDVIPIVRALSDEIFSKFYRADRDVVLERISANGDEAPPPLGTAIVPGHVIECMWFQIEIAAALGDRERLDLCARLVRRHLELGWDAEHGGLLLGVDADGAADVGWNFADYKLWWPHIEAMVATLLAYEHRPAPWCTEWYHRIESYSFARFPHPANGEWIQRLRRDGTPTTDVVALPVKDPFHLPRSLILCLECIERMTARSEATAAGRALDAGGD
jgi:N-acylglucosamine 2-epimerase